MSPPAARRWSLFGKLPGAGDFVRRNLDAGLAARLDEWLARELARRAEQDGELWDADVAAAPAWRFRVAAGVAGEMAVAGVLSPSSDRVGRVFPLLVFSDGAAPTEAAEACVGAGLSSAASPDVLLRDLAALQAPDEAPLPTPAAGRGVWRRDASEVLDLAGLPAGSEFDQLFPRSEVAA